jgi:sugar (pentulose or hexulose) kinase
MKRIPVIAIFDVGKTNKKVLLFNQQYQLLYEESKQFNEITDEDGFACEDAAALTQWVQHTFNSLLVKKEFEITAVNFSAYGASFVLLDSALQVYLPLYSYLKPYPQALQEKFYTTYGGATMVTRQTASPVLGNLNSGMQLYRLKYEQPEAFKKLRYALHLPQYLSYILTGKLYSDITSIGCHTGLWDFEHNHYHHWVTTEGIDTKLAPVLNTDAVGGYTHQSIPVGIGLHDSSAALIPYLAAFSEPFILISTGTWCISLNPFNHTPLSNDELQQDGLCYLSYKGQPVKAARLFAGYEHEQQVKRLAAHFNKPADYYKKVLFDAGSLNSISITPAIGCSSGQHAMVGQSAFAQRNLDEYTSYEMAYHQLIADIIHQQTHSTGLVLKGTAVKRIFVDGGFSNNTVYMNLLAEAFAPIEVFAATVPQASALGAALAIHSHWNSSTLATTLIQLKYYAPKMNLIHQK